MSPRHFNPSLSSTPTASTSTVPSLPRARPSRRRIAGVVVPRRHPAIKRACDYCRRRKQRCAPPADDPHSSACSNCMDGGVECVREPGTVARARARARTRRASPSVSDIQQAPFARPPDDDLVPENLPEIPLGTDSSTLSSFLAWRAELNAATLECFNAAAAQSAAVFAVSVAKADLAAAIATHKAAVARESNANMRASMALKRRRTARDHYFMLLGEVNSSSSSPSPPVASTSPGFVGKGKARRASTRLAEKGAANFSDEFEGFSEDSADSGELGAELMDLR